MINKNLKYECERTAVIILYIIYVMCGFSLFIVWQKNKPFESMFELMFPIVSILLFAVFITLCYLPTYIKTSKNHRKYQNIKKNGIRVTGEILECTYRTEHIADSRTTYYNIIVKYYDTKTFEEITITTPDLNFNPYTQLGSKLCNVYILDDEVYVSDFIGVKKGEKGVFQV